MKRIQKNGFLTTFPVRERKLSMQKQQKHSMRYTGNNEFHALSHLFEVPESATSMFETKEIFWALNRLLPKF